MDLGSGGDALQVPGPAAGTGFALGPGDGDVGDLAGHVVGASAGSPIEDEGAADPGAHRHHEDDLGPGAGTEPGLSGGVGVDVVLDVDRQLTQPLGGEPLANAGGDLRAGPSGDGVSGRQDGPPLDVDDAGRADPDRRDRRGLAGLLVRSGLDDRRDQAADGVEHGGRPLVSRGRAGAHRSLQGSTGVDQRGSHLGAAQVESDDERGLTGRR